MADCNTNDGKQVRATWFDFLRSELGMIAYDELIDPEIEQQDTDKPVGRAPMEDRRLYTYSEKLEEKSARTLVDARFCRNAEEREGLMEKAYEYNIKAGIAREIMWSNLKDEFHLWDPSVYVGLRKDFVVVSGIQKKE